MKTQCSKNLQKRAVWSVIQCMDPRIRIRNTDYHTVGRKESKKTKERRKTSTCRRYLTKIKIKSRTNSWCRITIAQEGEKDRSSPVSAFVVPTSDQMKVMLVWRVSLLTMLLRMFLVAVAKYPSTVLSQPGSLCECGITITLHTTSLI